MKRELIKNMSVHKNDWSFQIIVECPFCKKINSYTTRNNENKLVIDFSMFGSKPCDKRGCINYIFS